MGKSCSVCGKGAMAGHNVSHSHRKTKRRFKVNLQKTKISTDKSAPRALVCSRCLKSQTKSK